MAVPVCRSDWPLSGGNAVETALGQDDGGRGGKPCRDEGPPRTEVEGSDYRPLASDIRCFAAERCVAVTSWAQMTCRVVVTQRRDHVREGVTKHGSTEHSVRTQRARPVSTAGLVTKNGRTREERQPSTAWLRQTRLPNTPTRLEHGQHSTRHPGSVSAPGRANSAYNLSIPSVTSESQCRAGEAPLPQCRPLYPTASPHLATRPVTLFLLLPARRSGVTAVAWPCMVRQRDGVERQTDGVGRQSGSRMTGRVIGFS